MQDVRTINTGGWYGWGGFWDPGWPEVMVSPYAEGTLVLDLVDAVTKQLAWLAYCRDEIRDMKTRHENIEKTVSKALKQFPPKVESRSSAVCLGSEDVTREAIFRLCPQPAPRQSPFRHRRKCA